MTRDFKAKWNNNDILKFLELFEQFPILLNIKHFVSYI